MHEGFCARACLIIGEFSNPVSATSMRTRHCKTVFRFLNGLLRWLSRSQRELLLHSEAEATTAIFLFLKFYHTCYGYDCCFSLQVSHGYSLRNVFLSLLTLQKPSFHEVLAHLLFLNRVSCFLAVALYIGPFKFWISISVSFILYEYFLPAHSLS